MLARFFPFWALPVSFIFYEVGMFYYHKRERSGVGFGLGGAFLLLVLSITWIVMEGYWTAGPFIRETLQHFSETG